MKKIVKSKNKDNEFNVLVWNVECVSGSERGNKALLPVLDGIDIYNENVKPDVILLNEFYKYDDYPQFKQELEDEGYSLFEDSRKRKRGVNQVFIALSNKLKDAEIIEVINPNEENCDKMPNFLSVILQYKEKRIAIIGIRIKCATVSNQEFESRGKEFNEFLSYIRELQQKGIKDILIGGDFNNARIWGEENKLYGEKEIQKEYDGTAQKYYNFHTIKLESSKIGLKMVTPINENRSCGSLHRLKIDHLIVPNFWIVSNQKYTFKKGSSHAVLTATIKI